MAGTPTDHPAHNSLNTRISNLLVRTFAEYTGRGPTKVRTYVRDDVVTVVLQDPLTKGERSLVDDGRSDVVLNARRAYQETMRKDLRTGIEGLTNHRVIAFMSDNHIDPDIAEEPHG